MSAAGSSPLVRFRVEAGGGVLRLDRSTIRTRIPARSPAYRGTHSLNLRSLNRFFLLSSPHLIPHHHCDAFVLSRLSRLSYLCSTSSPFTYPGSLIAEPGRRSDFASSTSTPRSPAVQPDLSGTSRCLSQARWRKSYRLWHILPLATLVSRPRLCDRSQSQVVDILQVFRESYRL